MIKTDVNLVQGVFPVQQAKEVVLGLIAFKLKFHELEHLSQKERFGAGSSHSENRIASLQGSYDEMVQLLGQLGDGDVVEINSTIELMIKKN